MALLCYRCPLEEECELAKREPVDDAIAILKNDDFVYEHSWRWKHCPLMAILRQKGCAK